MTATLGPARGKITAPSPLGVERRRRGAPIWQKVRRRPLYAAAAAMFVVMVLMAVAGPWLPLPDPQTPQLSDRLVSPMTRGESGTLHLAGTDQLGRDVFSRTVHGARISIALAATVVLIAGIAGSALGLLAGYLRGPVDLLVMRLADLQMAFPGLLLALLVLYVLGGGIPQLVGLLAVLSWIGFARMARGQTLTLRDRPFIEAATCIGASPRRIMLRHILPHLLPVLAMVGVLNFAAMILAEAGLSFLGLGVQPPTASWGTMVAEGRDFVGTGAWWLFLTPGFAIFITVFSANLTSRWAQELLGITPR